jgi:hypothetical protein
VPPDLHDVDGDGNTLEPLPLDVRGMDRIADGNRDRRAVVDIGAYEAPPLGELEPRSPAATDMQDE